MRIKRITHERSQSAGQNAIDLKPLDPLIERYRGAKGNLIPLLQGVQKIYGYIPREALVKLSEETDLELNDMYGVATFYSQFRLNPVGKHIIQVCHGTACHVLKAKNITKSLEEFLKIRDGETTKDGLFTLESVACVGCCSLAPVVVRDGEFHGHLTDKSVIDIIKKAVVVIDGKLYEDPTDNLLIDVIKKIEKHGEVSEDSIIKKQKTQEIIDLGSSGIAAGTKKTQVMVGVGSCGIAAGAKKIYAKINALKNAENLDFNLHQTGCIGSCYREPLVEIIDDSGKYLYGNMDEDKVVEVVEQHIKKMKPVKDYVVRSNLFETPDDVFFAQQVKIALRNCGYIDPENIEEYEARDGYKAIKKIVDEKISSLDVIKAISDSGLRGRGGAGFPTGRKWSIAHSYESKEKHIVCNADEGDPGAFMDRSLLEGDPHSVIEGMIIAAYSIKATRGAIYCRAEYPIAIRRLNIALDQARAKGYLGKNIMGIDGFNFDVYLTEGAGAFVCGEETALLTSIEGNRGMPHFRPPFPAESGLWEKPTIINNVETFSNVPWIILNGAETFTQYGTEKSKGTKVFALVGKINRSGLVEVPMGMTIRDIVFNIGGGMQNGKKFKAVQLGGPSGGCIPADLADLKIDYESVNETGAIMGSGGLVVLDETTCLVDVARFFIEFTQKESCGKCTFCRIGTAKMLEILIRITEGNGKIGDIEKLEELSYQIKTTSLCGLGQTAPNPVLTTIKYFRDEYEAHIIDKRCPAKSCVNLLTYEVVEENCTGCGLCAEKCSVNAIFGKAKIPHFIDQNLCIKCNACYEVCEYDAIKFY